MKVGRAWSVVNSLKRCSRAFTQKYNSCWFLKLNERNKNLSCGTCTITQHNTSSAYAWNVSQSRILREHLTWFWSSSDIRPWEVFLSVEVKWCYFHMKNCLWRRVQELGLTSKYKKKRESYTSFSNACSTDALGCLRISLVAWLDMHSQALNNIKLSEFFYYFV